MSDDVRESKESTLHRAAQKRTRGAVPESYLLMMAGVMLLCCAGFVVLGQSALDQEWIHYRQQEAGRAAKWIVAALGETEDSAIIQRTLERGCHTIGAAKAVLFAANGQVREQWPLATATAPSENRGQGREMAVGAADLLRDGKVMGRLEISFPARGDSATGTGWLTAAFSVSACLIVAYLVFYRQLRNHARPYAAIEQSVQSYAAGMERQFAALTLSDTLGQMAVAWNTLVEDVSRLQSQISSATQPDAGAAMQRLESRTLRGILDRLPIGVMRLGSDRGVSYANAAAQRMLRVNGNPAGKSIAELLGDTETAEVLSLQAASSSAKPIDRRIGQDDAAVTLRLSLVPLTESCAPGENVLTIEDISHLQESEKARDQFLYHVTHELRTPLTNIQAYAETLSKPGFDDEQTRRECYNVIVSETRRLSRLVEDILSISQLEVGAARFDVGDVDLAKLVRQTVQDNLGGADGKKVELSLKMPPKMPRLRGDKQRLSVLLNNLIGNAVKYTPTGGRVTVAVEVQNRLVQVQVNDTGLGISVDDQKRIFEKFYRATSDSVQAIPGTGLGLAIAREVARLHGGDILVHSELGKGSQFTLELPLQEDTEEK